MFSTTGSVMIVSAVLAAGCGLDGGNKSACNVQDDCDAGYVCSNQMCVTDPGHGFEYGTVTPMTSASNGLVSGDYEALLGTTAAGGSLGCAVIRDENASPGTATSLVYAKIREGETGDHRCPTGTYAVVNDPVNCSAVLNGLFPGCVLYKQWDAGGTQITNRLGLGGYVTVEDVTHSDMDHSCNIDLSATFTGGVTIKSTFSFEYNPYAPDSSFCTH
jgi:hypothetical protein